MLIIHLFLPQVLADKYFDYTMLTLVLLASLELCFWDVSVTQGSIKNKVLVGLEIFFLTAFSIEVGDIFCPNLVLPRHALSRLGSCEVSRLWSCEALTFICVFGNLVHAWHLSRQAIVKVTVHGFAFNGKGSYIRDAWNAFDLVMISVYIVTIVLELCAATRYTLWLRAFRALR